MKAVNQCIGRVIRHRGDWAAILLVDQRWTLEQTAGKASCLPRAEADTLSQHASHDCTRTHCSHSARLLHQYGVPRCLHVGEHRGPAKKVVTSSVMPMMQSVLQAAVDPYGSCQGGSRSHLSSQGALARHSVA